MRFIIPGDRTHAGRWLSGHSLIGVRRPRSAPAVPSNGLRISQSEMASRYLENGRLMRNSAAVVPRTRG